MPSYSAYVTRTNRTDATIFLTEAAGEQVRFRSENNRYADDMAELGYVENPDFGLFTTPEEFYSVTVESASANAFELEATPLAGERPGRRCRVRRLPHHGHGPAALHGAGVGGLLVAGTAGGDAAQAMPWLCR